MEFVSVKDWAKIHAVSERTARNYCAQGKIKGAYLVFETNTIGITGSAVSVDDVIETTNHFRAIDYIIAETEGKLTEAYIKHLHFLLDKFRIKYNDTHE